MVQEPWVLILGNSHAVCSELLPSSSPTPPPLGGRLGLGAAGHFRVGRRGEANEQLFASFAWNHADAVGPAPCGCELEFLRGPECVWIVVKFGSEE